MKNSRKQVKHEEPEIMLTDKMALLTLNYHLGRKEALKLIKNDAYHSMDLKENLFRVIICETNDGTNGGKRQQFTYPLADLLRVCL